MNCKRPLAGARRCHSGSAGWQASAAAQTYPSKPVRMVVAFPPGGTIDALGRILAQKLTERWGQSVVVENRGGAAGNLGAIAAAQAPPDGYTIHLGAQSLATNVTIAPMANFDPVRDFEPVIAVATAQDVLMVPPTSPSHTPARNWIDYAKAHPGELNYASLGTGSSGHLATVLFAQVTGLKLQHVPYTTISQAVTDIIAGRISVWLATLGGHLGNIQAGKVRALAVSGPSRAQSFRRCRPSRSPASTSSRNRPGSESSCPRVRPRTSSPRSTATSSGARASRTCKSARRPARLPLHRRAAGKARSDAQGRDREMGRGGKEGGAGGALSDEAIA